MVSFWQVFWWACEFSLCCCFCNIYFLMTVAFMFTDALTYTSSAPPSLWATRHIKVHKIYIYIYSCITGKYWNTTIMYSHVQFILFNQILHTSIFNNWTSILYSMYCTGRKVLLPGITGIATLPVVPLLTCSQFPFHCFQPNHLQKLPTPRVKFCFTYTYLQWLSFDFELCAINFGLSCFVLLTQTRVQHYLLQHG